MCDDNNAADFPWNNKQGSSTITSLGLNMPNIFAVGNSPITTSGSIAVTLVSQAQNLIFASPDGSTGTPAFRSLVAADIPSLAESKITNLVSDLAALVPKTTTVNGHALSGNVAVTATDLSLNNLTNDAQVKVSDYNLKGKILVGTGVGTYVALTVGTNNQVLIADSTQTPGVKWSTNPAGNWGNIGGTLSAQTDLNNALGLLAPIASPTFTGTVAGITATMVNLGNCDNTSDVNKPVSTATQTQLNLKANLAGPTFTGTVAGITSTMVGLGNCDNTSDANKPVSTAQQTALNLKANLANPTFTGTVAGITSTMVGLGNCDNTSDVNKPVSTATQTALNLKANLASPTFTGTVAGITATMVGLGNCDNTSDVNKPVSTATQTQLNLKANLAGPTFTGTVAGITATMVGLGNVTNTAQIPLSTGTTKGDMLVFTASATIARLPVGTDGYVLIADSNQTNGIKWGTSSPGAFSAITGQPADNTNLASALSAKANLAGPTFTGIVSGITAAMVGLGNVSNSLQLVKANNLSDLATRQTALNNLIGTSTQGDIIYFNGTNWVNLAAGAEGKYLETRGSSNNPQWVKPATRTLSTGSASSITVNSDTTDIQLVTALSADLSIEIPSGSPVNGQKLIYRIRDNNVQRNLTWNAIFRAANSGAIPSVTIANKTMYFEYIYNDTDTKWDMFVQQTMSS